MPESVSDPNAPAAGARREVRYDAYAAVIASLVGLLALVVAGYTAWLQREQVKAQVWPYLIGGNSGGRNELVWLNKGVGPAIVRSVEVTVDGKPQRDWTAVLKALGLPKSSYQQSFLAGNVLSPGESLEWLALANKDDYDRFQQMAESRNLVVEVCYCSTLDECWLTSKSSTDRRPVASCPVLPEARRFMQ